MGLIILPGPADVSAPEPTTAAADRAEAAAIAAEGSDSSAAAHEAAAAGWAAQAAAAAVFQQAGTGAVDRTYQAKMRDVVSVKDFGAVGDGVAADRAAIITADAAGKPTFVPPGSYAMSSSTPLTNPMFLMGGILGNSVFGPCTIGVRDKQWWHHCYRPSSMYTGTPSGYVFLKDLSANYLNFNNQVGYQPNLPAGGRTMVAGHFIEGFHTGYGDCNAVFATIGVGKTALAGTETQWQNRNSATLFGGSIGATSNLVNVYGQEYGISDSGNADVAGFGLIIGFTRTAANTTGYTSPWIGVRINNQSVTQRIDVAYQAHGQFKLGLDLTGANLDTSQAAIILKQTQRIYFNADATAAGAQWFAGDGGTSLSSTYMAYNGSALVSVVGGNATLQVTSAQINVSGTVASTGAVRPVTNGVPSLGSATLSWANLYIAASGTINFNNSDTILTHSTGKLTNSGDYDAASGKVYRVNGNQVVAARDTGWTAMTGTTNKATVYDTSTVTLAQLAGRVMAMQAALTTHGLIGT